MPIDNSLNISELLRRLGAKGDSLASASVLESLRMSLIIGDLSDLVAPLRVPLGASSITRTSGAGFNNNWILECRSPGGLTVLEMANRTGLNYRVQVSPVTPFGAFTFSPVPENLASDQTVRSVFHSSDQLAGSGMPASALQIHGTANASMGAQFDNWVAPGSFFLIESLSQAQTEVMVVRWKEYPAALNPG